MNSLQRSISILKTLLLFLIWGVFLIITTTPTQAQKEDAVFSTLDSLYTVSETTTFVTHTLVFENQNPTIFINQFGFQIPHINLEKIAVEVDGKPIIPNTIVTDKHTSIGITFKDKLVGQGKKRSIVISYQDPEIASFTQSSGQVLIPQPNQIETFDRYTLRVNSPEKSGLPLITSQTPNTSTLESSGAEVTYNQLQPGTLSLYYGQQQAFTFSLQHTLTNENNGASIQQIPLPPDTPFQTVFFSQIEPKPNSIDLDEDGNWVATYHLEDQSQQTITITGEVVISREKKQYPKSNEPSKKHLKTTEFWQPDNKEIQTAFKHATTIEHIWDLLLPLEPFLSFNQTRTQPTDALNQNTVSAENIVDLLISAARRADIPSRRAVGITFDNDKTPLGLPDNNLHTWAEYYDTSTQTWLPLDPFWQLALGDPSFINQPYLAKMVLAYNGISSTTPFPQHLSSEIYFKPINTFPSLDSEVTNKLTPQFSFKVPVPGAYNLEITNQSGQALYQFPIVVSDTSGKILFQDTITTILPYQSNSIPLYLYTNDWFTSDEVTLQLVLDGKSQTITITRGPKIYNYLFSPLGFIVGTSFIVGTLAVGSVLVFRRK